MTQRSTVNPGEIEQRIREGEPRHEIAASLGVSVSTVQRAAYRAGLVNKQKNSHKEARPWVVSRAHKNARESQYLYRLSFAMKGLTDYDDELAVWETNTAITWAEKAVKLGKDVDYDPVSGFYLKDADRENWHLKNLLAKVRRAKMANPNQK